MYRCKFGRRGSFLTDNCHVDIYKNWLLDCPEYASSHITIKELAMINEAVQAWAPYHNGHHLFIACDNMAAVFMTNTGATRHSVAARILRNMADTALKYDISITAYHIKGEVNDIPDSISRLHATGQLLRLSSLLSNHYHPFVHPTYFLPCHMSYMSYLFLLPQVTRYHSWMQKSHITGHIASPRQQCGHTDHTFRAI